MYLSMNTKYFNNMYINYIFCELYFVHSTFFFFWLGKSFELEVISRLISEYPFSLVIFSLPDFNFSSKGHLDLECEFVKAKTLAESGG